VFCLQMILPHCHYKFKDRELKIYQHSTNDWAMILTFIRRHLPYVL
jgi:hypothetical protein